MSSSSSFKQQKSSDISEPVAESKKPGKAAVFLGYLSERTVQHSHTHHLKTVLPTDRSPQHSRQKRSILSFASSSLQSNFFAHSPKEKLQARPFDEFLMTSVGSDDQKTLPIKTDGQSAPPRTAKQP